MAQDLDGELDDLELRKNLGIHPKWTDPAAVGKAAHAAPVATPALPRLPGPPAAGAIPGAAAARAAKLASDAMALDLAQAAGDPAASRETVRLLLAHQVAAGHSLMMRLTAIADAYVNYVQPAAMRDPYLSRCPQEAVRLAHGAARLMERVRAGALALQRLGYPGTADPLPPAPPPLRPPPPEHNPDPSSPPDRPPQAPAPMPHPARPAAAHLRRGRLNNGNPPGDFLLAPRCGAATRAGHECAQPAMSNGRCRLHGGKSTGPRTADGLARARNARLIHGFRSGALIKLRRNAGQTARDLQRLTDAAKQEAFTTKSQRARRERGSRAPAGYAGNMLASCAAEGRAGINATNPGDAPVTSHGRFVSFLPAESSAKAGVTLWCNPASPPRPAGHGLDRSDLSVSLDTCPPKPLAKADGVHRPDLPLPPDGAYVQTTPVAATTSGPSARARP